MKNATMKEKVKKIVEDKAAALNEAINNDDVQAMISALRFLDGAVQAYASYLAVMEYGKEPTA